MNSDSFEAAKRSSQSWYWWGIPTFFRCPWVEDPGACDIALVGVPHILQCLRGLNVIGGDVVCLMPTKDSPNQITAQVAMVIMFEMISLIACELAARTSS
jgi:hypothetical protein